ncbi:hypothetical protein B0H11DRAFT_1916361 [Mycena galericulata]|nr:hypothetical protein B0H11DRAFT_1916361 [Mycena galericulata]
MQRMQQMIPRSIDSATYFVSSAAFIDSQNHRPSGRCFFGVIDGATASPSTYIIGVPACNSAFTFPVLWGRDQWQGLRENELFTSQDERWPCSGSYQRSETRWYLLSGKRWALLLNHKLWALDILNFPTIHQSATLTPCPFNYWFTAIEFDAPI